MKKVEETIVIRNEKMIYAVRLKSKTERVKVICSEARLKEVGVRQKHIKHILGKIGTVKEIRKLPNTEDMYAYFVHFRYVNLKAAPGNKKPYYVMLDDMIEPINLEVVGEKKE